MVKYLNVLKCNIYVKWEAFRFSPLWNWTNYSLHWIMMMMMIIIWGDEDGGNHQNVRTTSKSKLINIKFIGDIFKCFDKTLCDNCIYENVMWCFMCSVFIPYNVYILICSLKLTIIYNRDMWESKTYLLFLWSGLYMWVCIPFYFWERNI